MRDTDSIFVDKELDPSHAIIGRGLGEFKLEYILKEAVFLCPKIYAGIPIDKNMLNIFCNAKFWLYFSLLIYFFYNTINKTIF